MQQIRIYLNLTPAGKDVIKDTAAWKVKANSNAAETVKGGDEVVFKDGAGVNNKLKNG